MSKQSNLEYWRRREAEWEREYQRDMMRYEREIDQIYKNLMDDMQAEIDGWYAKFAKQEGLSMSDAQIKLSKADQDYYARRARERCELAEIDMKAGNRDHENIYFSDLANAEMRIYNAKMRISRMEALKGMLRLETMRATGLIDQRMHDILIKDAEDKLRKEAKILGPTVLGAIHRIPTIVRASFHGATFSKRLWGSHQDTMKRDLQKILARGLIMGESPERFRKQIEKDLQIEGTKAKKAAKRLLATEFARVQVQAQAEAFKEIGIEEFQFVTAAGCCDDCQANDGKIFKLRKGETGGNLPPMHPHCRCAIAPYSDRKEYDQWLDGYANHGMTYEEWKARDQKATAIEMSQTAFVTNKNLESDNSRSVNRKFVNTKKYHDKFEHLTPHKAVNEALYQISMRILEHRDGTDFEDLYVINARNGEVIAFNDQKNEEGKSGLTYQQYLEVMRSKEPFFLLHNHPNSGRLSFADIDTVNTQENAIGTIAVGHDGTIHIGKNFTKTPDLRKIWDKEIESFKSMGFPTPLAKHKALDKIYELGIFEYEKR